MSFDFAAVTAPFRMQPGLRRLGPGSTQLTPLRPGDRAQREKLAVLAAHSSQALLVDPDFDAVPALRALAAHAAAEHPKVLSWDGTGTLHAHHLGWSVAGTQLRHEAAAPSEIGACLEGLAPEWRFAGLLSLAFAEDFAVIDGRSTRIPWLAVCLPSHWAPEDKIGRHFAEVHAPVADNQLLVTAADALARLVTGPDRWERFVWTITHHPRLHAHPARCCTAGWPSEASAEALAQQAFFRTERQTFIPLPDHVQALFTIRVEVHPLNEAITTRDQASRVHAALASMSPAVLAYRGLSVARDRLLQWLALQAAQMAA